MSVGVQKWVLDAGVGVGCGDGAGRVQKGFRVRGWVRGGEQGSVEEGCRGVHGGAGKGASWRGGCSGSLGCKGVQKGCRRSVRCKDGCRRGCGVQGWMQKCEGCGEVQGQIMERAQVDAEVQLGCRGMQEWVHGEGSWGYRRVLGTGGMQEGCSGMQGRSPECKTEFWKQGGHSGCTEGLPHAWKEFMDGVKSVKWVQR